MESLEKQCDLWIFPKGKFFFQVPYPSELKQGVQKSHPGYFWGNLAEEVIFDLFEVFDAKEK